MNVLPPPVVLQNAILVYPESVATLLFEDDLHALFVRQYRESAQSITWELPGGRVREDESIEEAAVRELREETGCTAEGLDKILSLDMDFSVSRHRTHIFLGRLDEKREPEEEIEVESLALSVAAEMIGSGKITHAPSVVAILWAIIHRKS